MKALWILNSPLGTAAQVLGYSYAASGTWIATAEQQLKTILPELRVDYAVLGSQNRVVTDDIRGCTVYELAMKQLRGKRGPKAYIAQWKKLLEDNAPDLIHIWGTEFTFPLDVMDACGKTPVAIAIQGVVTSLAKFCTSDVPYGELMKGHRLTAIPAWFRARKREKAMIRQVTIEKQILQRADAILLDNDWSGAYCGTGTSKAELIDFPLAINPVFEQTCWNQESYEKNSLFTIAPSTAMKGMHMLIKALALVKQQIPNVKLYIPGSLPTGRLAALTLPPYIRYLKRLIRDLKVENNVVFCGKLTSEQMAQQLSRANVFVMPSRAENISTSLREAMWVGTPSVTAMVGSLHEIAHHNENALCYRYEEYELLAHYILKVMNDDDLAVQLGNNGRNMIKKRYPMNQPLDQCASWYERVSRR